LIGETESQVTVAGIRFSCEDKIIMDVKEVG
jgi:hypothetical protein